MIDCDGAVSYTQTIQVVHEDFVDQFCQVLAHCYHQRQGTKGITQAKHLRLYGNKLFKFAKAAAAGQSSPKNLLKGRVDTKEAYTKLLLEIAPRLKDIKHNFIVVSKIFRKRRGDNAPLVTVSIKGCEKLEQRKASY